MAIVQNPITGRTKQKFGTAVFSKQFSKNTMRTKPIEVKNPRTPDQVNQRNKFSLMVAEGRRLLTMLKVSFQNMTTDMSAFNVFIKNNIKTAITGLPGSYAIDYSLLLIAKGPLYKTSNITAGNELASKVKRSWIPPIDPVDPANLDLLYVATYNEDKKEWFYSATTTTRITGVDQQDIPATWAGDTVHVFSFFVNPDGNQSSDSVYSGTVEITL
ncbi:MAG: DUF6266 family protein [Bacteroidales bacterium]|jgi:hypothetical protein|nr:DUF6266 family protein [Bacteroidales bacterium]